MCTQTSFEINIMLFPEARPEQCFYPACFAWVLRFLCHNIGHIGCSDAISRGRKRFITKDFAVDEFWRDIMEQ